MRLPHPMQPWVSDCSRVCHFETHHPRGHLEILLVLIPCTRNTNLAQWPHVKNRSPFKFHRPKITITARALGDLRARITPKSRGHSRRSRRRPALARAASNPPRAIAPIIDGSAAATQHRSAKVVAQQPGCHGMHECSEISLPFERVPVRPCIASTTRG